MKNNHRGFTLVELLGVMVLIGLIGAIAYPTINNVVNKGSDQVAITNINTILDAAYNWTLQNTASLPKENNDSISITISELKQKGYLDVNIKDAITKVNIPNDSTITITKGKENSSSQYHKYYGNYLFEFTMGSSLADYNAKAPIISLVGRPVEYVEIGDSYEDKGVVAKDYKNKDIDDITIAIYNQNTQIGSISTDTLQSYRIEYSAIDDENNVSTITRNVIVRDTEAPIITLPIITDEKVHLPIDLDDIKYNAACRDNSHSCTINKYLMDESLKSGDKAIIIYEASDSSGNKTEERLVLTIE